MIKIAKYLVTLLAIVGVVDFVGFLGWALSGQLPPDGFYIGAITWHLIHDFWSVYPYLLVAWIFLAPIVGAFVAYTYAKREVHSTKQHIVSDVKEVLDVLAATDVLLANSVTDIYKTLKPKVRKLRVKSRK